MENVTSIPSKEEYVYRFLPLRYFLQLLDNRSLFFPRVSTWEDPYELFLFKQRFIDKKGMPINVFSQSENIFGQCWTTQRDSDALWRIYSPSLMSVRIKTTISRIKSFIEQNQGNGLLIKSGMVDYQAQNQIEAWLPLLCITTKRKKKIFNKCIQFSICISRGPYAGTRKAEHREENIPQSRTNKQPRC